MVIPEEMTRIISIINSSSIWLIIGIFFVFSYLLISLLTWSFIKPLKYLGIPTFAVGIIIIILRLLAKFAVNLLDADFTFIKTFLPSLLSPVLKSGIICAVVGVGMIVGYILINKYLKKKHDNPEMSA